MADCLIALGANLGDRVATLEAALAAIAADPQSRLLARSSFHETAAIGGPPGQEPFLNAAARIETSRSCEAAWELLVDVERRLGRVRDVRWGPRTVDLDLLLYDALEVATPRLEVPHPRMAFRRFVLGPAAEIAADMIHPATRWTVGRLLAHLDARPNYVAITGPVGAGKSHLASALAADAAWRLIREPIADERLAAYYRDPRAAMLPTERAILAERIELLDAAEWTEPDAWAVSDFWFDQTLAFANWALGGGHSSQRRLGDEAYAALSDEWNAAAAHVARPKFVVWLDGPNEVLLERIAARGREYERRLGARELDDLRAALAERLRRDDVGPVLRLDATRLDWAAVETRAAADAMG